MSKNFNNTTRRFPRTLQEAFPNDPQYAASVEVTRAKLDLEMFVLLACVFGAGFLTGLVCVKIF
jgi:hypothetical protein